MPYVPSFKKCCIENLLAAYAWAVGPKDGTFSPHPKSIFVLRNNDRGDLLTTTPLFEGLKKAFPESELLVGTGSWNRPLLEHNPYIDNVLTLDAPWHNKTLAMPHGALRRLLRGLWYSIRSSQVKALRALKPAIGIDVLGSPEGAFLLMQAKIPYRLGVRGYAGGYTACQGYLDFDPTCHVSSFALRFLELLGKESACIAPRPQLYLTPQERQEAKNQWLSYEQVGRKLRVVLAPGGGNPQKCWPLESFRMLLEVIQKGLEATVVLTGSGEEKLLGQSLKAACPWVHDSVGCHSLRSSLALAEQADCIICNSSLMMHVGAAFQKKTLVLLGEAFEDARAHERLWSYPATHTILGKISALDVLPSPAQAWEAFQLMLKQS